jgi:hypothetical protein
MTSTPTIRNWPMHWLPTPAADTSESNREAGQQINAALRSTHSRGIKSATKNTDRTGNVTQRGNQTPRPGHPIPAGQDRYVYTAPILHAGRSRLEGFSAVSLLQVSGFRRARPALISALRRINREVVRMSRKRTPAPPDSLVEGSAGFRFWEAVHEAYVIPEPQQLALVEQACLVLSRIEEIEAAMVGQPPMLLGGNKQMTINPLLAHAKDLRGTFLSYAKALALPLDFGDEEEQQRAADRSRRAREAANSRWGKVVR